MENNCGYQDPEEMSPEERYRRIVHLLTIAVIRLMSEENKPRGLEEQTGTLVFNSLLPVKTGPVPFGQSPYGLNRGRLRLGSDLHYPVNSSPVIQFVFSDGKLPSGSPL